MRAFVNLQALVTLDIDQAQKVLDQTLTFDDNDATTASQIQSGVVTLAAAEANTQFNFGSVASASMLLIIAYQEVHVRLNDIAAPLVPVRPVPAAVAASVLSRYQREDQPGLVLWRGKVDSLYLTNPSGTTAAQALVAVVGDAT